ncbi:hypothetical protein ABZ636_38940 [Streptomyces sp. NPDC007251]|uniref:hypothetical protein n=1 Tax=Streptomyces sp. NPDC007251 TaxID=3154483 RepID=UPI00341051A0
MIRKKSVARPHPPAHAAINERPLLQAANRGPGEAGDMAERRVIVSCPARPAARRTEVDDLGIGTAYSVHDLEAFLQQAGLEVVDEIDVTQSPLIEWHGDDVLAATRRPGLPGRAGRSSSRPAPARTGWP